MRIHTRLSLDEIRLCARAAGVSFERLTVHGSRSRPHAFDVILTGSGRIGGQWGNSGTHGAGPYIAATWDEWGIFLGRVFGYDQAAHATYYRDANDFHWQTGYRFEDGVTITPTTQHRRHKWQWLRSITGHSFDWCACGAERHHGHLSDYTAREGGGSGHEYYSGKYASHGGYAADFASDLART